MSEGRGTSSGVHVQTPVCSESPHRTPLLTLPSLDKAVDIHDCGGVGARAWGGWGGWGEAPAGRRTAAWALGAAAGRARGGGVCRRVSLVSRTNRWGSAYTQHAPLYSENYTCDWSLTRVARDHEQG